MNETEKLEFEAFRKWMFSHYISPKKTGGQVLSLINSGTGKMLFEVWKEAKQPAPSIKYCLWDYDKQRQCHDTQCGKYIEQIEAESPAKYCLFCGGIITSM